VKHVGKGGPQLASEQSEDKLILWVDPSPERAALCYSRLPENRRNYVIWTKTAEEAIITLQEYSDRLEAIYLEHDLEGEMPNDTRSELSGMEVVRFLEKCNDTIRQNLKDTHFIIHSWNEYASAQLAKRLARLGFIVRQKPFGL